MREWNPCACWWWFPPHSGEHNSGSVLGLPSISLEAGDLSLDWGEGKWRHRECHFPFLPFTTSLDVFLHFRKMCPVWGCSQRSANSLILGSRGSGLGTQGLPPRPSQWLGNWCGQLHANASLHSPSFQETLFPNSLYGEILDRMEANMSKPMWYVGRCNTEALATWSLTSGHRTLRTLPTSHQGPGNEPIGELFSGFKLCQLYSLDTLFLIDSTHSLIPVALRYRGICYVGTFASISPINPFPV